MCTFAFTVAGRPDKMPDTLLEITELCEKGGIGDDGPCAIYVETTTAVADLSWFAQLEQRVNLSFYASPFLRSLSLCLTVFLLSSAQLSGTFWNVTIVTH